MMIVTELVEAELSVDVVVLSSATPVGDVVAATVGTLTLSVMVVPAGWALTSGLSKMMDPKPAIVFSSELGVPSPRIIRSPTVKPNWWVIWIIVAPGSTPTAISVVPALPTALVVTVVVDTVVVVVLETVVLVLETVVVVLEAVVVVEIVVVVELTEVVEDVIEVVVVLTVVVVELTVLVLVLVTVVVVLLVVVCSSASPPKVKGREGGQC
jgi:hypothetical protein